MRGPFFNWRFNKYIVAVLYQLIPLNKVSKVDITYFVDDLIKNLTPLAYHAQSKF